MSKVKKLQNFLPQLKDEATVRGRDRFLYIHMDIHIHLFGL